MDDHPKKTREDWKKIGLRFNSLKYRHKNTENNKKNQIVELLTINIMMILVEL